MIKHLEKQTVSGQCAGFNLANLLQDDVIREYGQQDRFMPSGLFQLNEMLEIEDYPFRLESIASMPTYNTLICKATFYDMCVGWQKYMASEYEKKINEDYFIPFVLNVQTGNTEKSLHAVSLLWHKNIWYLSDPLKDRAIEINNILDIYDNYLGVNSIAMFTPKDQEGYLGLVNHN